MHYHTRCGAPGKTDVYQVDPEPAAGERHESLLARKAQLEDQVAYDRALPEQAKTNGYVSTALRMCALAIRCRSAAQVAPSGQSQPQDRVG